MIKTKYSINYWANFYFFVQNLANWHFSCSKNYNNYWKKQYGPLPENSYKLLVKFCKLHQHYGFGPKYLGRVFFETKSPILQLKKKLPIKEYQTIKKLFLILQPIFTKVWKSELPRLKRWQKILTKQLPLKQKSIEFALTSLYQASPDQKTVFIFLLLSSPQVSGGGANINNHSITIELSNIPTEEASRILGIIWHELIHLLFEKKVFIPLINDTLTIKPRIKINEVVASVLFPKGILAKKFLKINQIDYQAFIGLKNKKKIISLTESYIRYKKPLDKNYLKQIVN